MHISFAFPIHSNTDTLWFVGSGMAVIFSGLLNFVALDCGGSKFNNLIALIINGLNGVLFCWALAILNEPQIYVGITIFLVTTVAFFIRLIKHR